MGKKLKKLYPILDICTAPQKKLQKTADRLDYISAMFMNWGYVLTVEKVAGICISPRAEYLRVLIGELNRIASHLLFYGTFGMDVGAYTPFLWAFREREKILDLFEALCGQRLTYNYYRIGGVSHPPPPGWMDKLKAFLENFKKVYKELDDILTNNVIFLKRTKGIGILSKEKAIAWGCTGPVLRGSGVDWDLRRDETYSVYKELKFDVPVGENGDVWDRYWVRMQEMLQSVRIIEQCITKLEEMDKELASIPHGAPGWRDLAEFCIRTKSVLEVEPGEAYVRIESSRGELGYYLVSKGGNKPWRLKIRSGAFCNLSVLPEIAREHLVADLIAILASLDIMLGEIDR
jgi:NADH-quinone oxidoreductase subunit D